MLLESSRHRRKKPSRLGISSNLKPKKESQRWRCSTTINKARGSLGVRREADAIRTWEGDEAQVHAGRGGDARCSRSSRAPRSDAAEVMTQEECVAAGLCGCWKRWRHGGDVRRPSSKGKRSRWPLLEFAMRCLHKKVRTVSRIEHTFCTRVIKIHLYILKILNYID